MAAPIVLFVYDRPEHTRRTLEALSVNDLADVSRLHVFSDGPHVGASPEAQARIEHVRAIVHERDWCGTLNVVERDVNLGLAGNVVDGVTSVVSQSGRVIVLEDDIVTGTGFLRYMNETLDLYAVDEQVMHISAFMHPVETPSDLGNTFFYNVTSCWGWGTWDRAWRHYESDAAVLLQRLRAQRFDSLEFNGGQGSAHIDQLRDNVSGVLHTWAVRWHTSVYLAGGSCLHPRTSMVTNIGFDGSGTHCGEDEPKGLGEVVSYVSPHSKVRPETNMRSHRAVSRLVSSYRNRSAAARPVTTLRSTAMRIKRMCRRFLRAAR